MIQHVFINPQQGDLDTVLQDVGVALAAGNDVLVFNVDTLHNVIVRTSGSQLIDGALTKTVSAMSAVLFVSDGSSWHSMSAGSGAASSAITAACRVYRTTNQTLTTGVSAPISFDAERFDTDAMHDGLSNTSRITIKTAGKYLIGASLTFDASAVGDRQLLLRLNGLTLLSNSREPGAANAAITANIVYDLAVNDYIEALAVQYSGGNLDVLTSGNFTPEFWAHRLGDNSSAGVLASRRINTTSPLTGGGDLSADLTLGITAIPESLVTDLEGDLGQALMLMGG